MSEEPIFTGRLYGESGERRSFNIPVRANNGDSTFIPVTVLNVQTRGEVLGLFSLGEFTPDN